MEKQKMEQLAEQCLSVRMRLLNRMVNSIFDKALRPYNIKASQMNILTTVAHYQETTCREVCSLLQMDRSTFSRSLTRLKKHHWLSSEPSGDGKIRKIKITREGISKVEEIYPVWQQAQNQVADILGNNAVDAIREAGTKQLKTGFTS